MLQNQGAIVGGGAGLTVCPKIFIGESAGWQPGFALPSPLGWVDRLDKRTVSISGSLNSSRLSPGNRRNPQKSGFGAWITQAKSEAVCSA